MKKFHRLTQLCVVFAIGFISFTPLTHASTLDCQNLYVGLIMVDKGNVLKGVVFLNGPNDSGGSYFSYFDNWGVDEKKAVLSLLMTAKVMQHRVTVETEEPGGCGIQTGWRQVKNVYLTNNP